VGFVKNLSKLGRPMGGCCAALLSNAPLRVPFKLGGCKRAAHFMCSLRTRWRAWQCPWAIECEYNRRRA
jgi:hypothetical protein